MCTLCMYLMFSNLSIIHHILVEITGGVDIQWNLSSSCITVLSCPAESVLNKCAGQYLIQDLTVLEMALKSLMLTLITTFSVKGGNDVGSLEMLCLYEFTKAVVSAVCSCQDITGKTLESRN